MGGLLHQFGVGHVASGLDQQVTRGGRDDQVMLSLRIVTFDHGLFGYRLGGNVAFETGRQVVVGRHDQLIIGALGGPVGERGDRDLLGLGGDDPRLTG